VNPVIIVLIPLIGLAIALLLSWGNLKRILQIWRIPTTAMNNLPTDGQVEVMGKVVNDATQSPITHTPCAMWFLKVTEMRRYGRNTRRITLYQGLSEDTFEIHDEMGSVHVAPAGADLILKTDVKDTGGWFHSLDEQTTTQLQSLGIDTKGFLGMNRDISVRESYVVSGDPLFVLGSISQTDQGRVINRPSKAYPFLISDRSEKSLLTQLYVNVGGTAFLGIFFGVLVDILFFYHP